MKKLSRTEMKNIMGGDDSGGGSCTTKCTGDKWNSSLLRYERVTENCIYFAGSGGLPSSCGCSSSLQNATACA